MTTVIKMTFYAFTEAIDYGRVLQLVAFQIGDSSATRRCFSVVASADSEEEGAESFILELTSGDLAVVISSERGSATVTIVDGKGKLYSFCCYTYILYVGLLVVMVWEVRGRSLWSYEIMHTSICILCILV